MTDYVKWRRVQRAISSVQDEEDVKEVRAKIRSLPDEDPDRRDLAHQLALVADGLEGPEA